MSLAKIFVVSTQTILWSLFMAIDAWLLIPSILLRYIKRVKSQKEQTGRRSTVVIVGGNFAGLAALRQFADKSQFRVILIDQRDYFEYTPGVWRLFCEPHHSRKLAHPLPHGAHRIIHGRVTQADGSRVTYLDPTTRKAHFIKFDYLIWATGSTYNYPISGTETTLPARALGWKATAKQVARAQSILILGGGAVGTELAAELVDYDPSKSITLVDASSKLVPLFAPKVSDYAEQWLRARNVQLLLGQALQKWDASSCTFSNGTVLTSDLVFVCFGNKPNSGALLMKKDTLLTNGKGASPPPVKLDQRNCVVVDQFLRVTGRRNVFSCGDVATPPTEGDKQAFQAEVQGHVAADNVIRLATGRPFLRYPEDATAGNPQMPLVYVLSLGKWDGVIGFNNMCIPGPLAAVMKWIIEWTKVRQMLGRPVGTFVWAIGDAVAIFISNHILPRSKRQPWISADRLLSIVSFFKKDKRNLPFVVEILVSWLAAFTLACYLCICYLFSTKGKSVWNVPLTTTSRTSKEHSIEETMNQLKKLLESINHKKDCAASDWSDDDLVRLLRSSTQARKLASLVMKLSNEKTLRSGDHKLLIQLKEIWPQLLRLPSINDRQYDFDITLVVPAYREKGAQIRSNLQRALKACHQPTVVQVVLVDAGGNTDIQSAFDRDDNDQNKKWGSAKLVSYSDGGGRGPTLNFGAKHANGKIITFLHSDNILPEKWDVDVQSAFCQERQSQSSQTPKVIGCAFAFRIDRPKSEPTAPGLAAAQLLGTIRTKCFHVLYGDSVLSIPASYFRYMGGYPEHALMEDYEMMDLLRKRASYFPEEDLCIHDAATLISARRWQTNGVSYVTLFNFLCVFLYENRGWSPEKLYQFYYQRR